MILTTGRGRNLIRERKRLFRDFKFYVGKRRACSSIRFWGRCFRKPYLFFISLTAFLFCFSLATTDVHSALVTLGWDPATDPNIAGYKIYYGTSSRSYQSSLNAGNNTTGSVSLLDDGRTYYFAVTAYDRSGNESPFSEELAYTSPQTCNYTLSLSNQSFGSSGGTGGVNVSAGGGCSWTAVSNASWIIVTSNSSGSGSSSVNYSVTSNPSSASRSGTMTIAGNTFTVTQSGAACSYSISPTSQSFNSTGGTGSVSVTSPSGCSWTASSSASWITINSGSSGSGSGTTSYSVSANPGSSSRSGSLTVAGQTFTVTQSGVSCSYSLSSASQSFNSTGGAGSVGVTSPSGCSWTASSSASWITINSGSSGSGSGTTSYSVSANTASSSRSGSLTLAGQTFSVTQSGVACSYSISPTSQSFSSTGGTGSVSITTPSSCSWSASSNASWITISPLSIRSGNDTINFSISPNTSATSRSTTITIADRTFTVNQEAISPAGTVVLALKAGGTEYLSKAGIRYQADAYYRGGDIRSTGEAINKTIDASLYQAERFGSFSYAIPLANGNYELTLQFAELTWNSRGQRVFDVSIEGNKVLNQLDLFAVAGKNTAYDVSFLVNIQDGLLHLDFLPISGEATISAILIRTLSDSSNSPQAPAQLKRYFSTEPLTPGQ